MKKLLTVTSVLILPCRAAVVSGCTSWVIMPDRSASGRMLIHKCRDQHIGRLTASINTADAVRWMCIGASPQYPAGRAKHKKISEK